MSDSPDGRDDHPTEDRTTPATADRAVTDGGSTAVAAPSHMETVIDRTRRTGAPDVPRLDGSGGEHLFGPAELPPWALSLPVVGGLAVAVGAQGSTVLSAGGGSAWLGTVLTTVVILVVVSIALRSA